MDPRHLQAVREAVFPNLRKEDYCVTSKEDSDYNCIAHAADKNDAPWWPMPEETEGVFWPKDVPREETLECFVFAYHTEGYLPCDSSEPEAGIEKIALYVDADGNPTHAAKQLVGGAWSSKLGMWEDIEHKALANLEAGRGGAGYGKVVQILKRNRLSPTPPGTESASLQAAGDKKAEQVATTPSTPPPTQPLPPPLSPPGS